MSEVKAKKRTQNDRNMELAMRLSDTICSIYMEAIRHHEPHSWILSQVSNRVLSNPGRGKFSAYYHGKVSGVSDACLKMHYTHLVFGWVYEGTFYNWDSLPENVKDLVRAQELVGNHFYIGTIKPFGTN